MRLVYEGAIADYEEKIKATARDRKTLIFFDAKSAFDSVNWRILRKKMVAKGYDSQVINTIEQLYGRAHTTPGLFAQKVKIHKGVL